MIYPHIITFVSPENGILLIVWFIYQVNYLTISNKRVVQINMITYFSDMFFSFCTHFSSQLIPAGFSLIILTVSNILKRTFIRRCRITLSWYKSWIVLFEVQFVNSVASWVETVSFPLPVRLDSIDLFHLCFFTYVHLYGSSVWCSFYISYNHGAYS